LLVLRLQRVGRKKLAHFRLVAQEHSLSPKSGRVVEQLGSFNPYTKDFTFKKEAIEKRLSNGAQPSNRVARLLKDNGVDLPSWVKITEKHSKPKKEPVDKPEAEKAPEAPKEQPADEKQEEPAPTEEKSEEASA